MDWTHVGEWALGIAGTVVAAFIIGSLSWLVKKVLTLDKDIVEMKSRMNQQEKALVDEVTRRDARCQSHSAILAKLDLTLDRTDKNVVRLCTKVGADYDEEK